jgi:hypothetical protein
MSCFIRKSRVKEFQTHTNKNISQHINSYNSESLLYTLRLQGTYSIEKNFCHYFIIFEMILELLEQVNSSTEPDTMKYEHKQIAEYYFNSI